MKTIEIIKVRTGSSASHAIKNTLQKIVIDAASRVKDCVVKVYEDASVNGDYAYFLYWDANIESLDGSAMALEIRKSLETLGMVDYATWTPIGRI